jgi:hypothetical protein
VKATRKNEILKRYAPLRANAFWGAYFIKRVGGIYNE